MKILILTNSSGGLYNFRKELLKEFLKTNEIIIGTPKGDFVPMLEKMGCTVLNTEFQRRGKNILKEFELFLLYMKIIKKISPDVILTYTIKPTLYGGIVARIYKKKCIANITGLGSAVESKGILHKLLIYMYKVSFKNCYCVFFQNSANMKFFEERKIIGENTKKYLIPGSGVNVKEHYFEEYPKTKEGEDRFLFIGRIMKDKGIEEYLTTAKKIKQKHPLTSFEIIGHFDEDYSTYINQAQRDGFIKYLGEQSNVHFYIKNCNALILPSYHEGMSNVLLEAAATGRPVLASDIPGCRETFEEGITGLGFQPHNAEDLCEKIEKFINLTNDEKRVMGKKAREKIEKEFDRKIIVEKYVNELKKVEREKNVTL